jgi:hypothetical protein
MRTDPPAVIRCTRLGLVLAAGVVIAGCCSDEVGDVSILPSTTPPVPIVVWVGDSTVLYSEARRNSAGWLCLMPLYTSKTAPDRFAYSSTSAAVTVSSRGVARATGVGGADITVSSAGLTSGPLRITVLRPVAEIRLTATPAAPQVGDTITIRATPVDDATTVSGATLLSFALVSPSEQLGSWLPGGTPTLARFYATDAGDLRAFSKSPHGFSPQSVFADTLTVTIAPRPVGQTQRTGRD